MIVKPSVEELMKNMDSRYTLVVAVSKRARQIVDGDSILVKTTSTKPVSIAIQEISQKKVGFTRHKPQPAPAASEETIEQQSFADPETN